ncbi:hypothetical protein JCM10296v2_004732 [Rhodotorula toruloides]
MSINPATPTDEPTRRDRPDVASSLPTEILQNIFTRLYHLVRGGRFETRGFGVQLQYVQLDKRILSIAMPIWMGRFSLPPDPDNAPKARGRQ